MQKKAVFKSLSLLKNYPQLIWSPTMKALTNLFSLTTAIMLKNAIMMRPAMMLNATMRPALKLNAAEIYIQTFAEELDNVSCADTYRENLELFKLGFN